MSWSSRANCRWRLPKTEHSTRSSPSAFQSTTRRCLILRGGLVKESRTGFPLGTVVWNETASRFIEILAAHHMSGGTRTRGTLDKALLMRMRDFIMANLDQPIDVATLARMADRSQFHFSRAFARSVGVSPYQYVIHLRLQHAVELVQEGRLGLAEIAASTGFADQSHLSRWIKRACGVSLTQLFPRPGAEAHPSSIPRRGTAANYEDASGERGRPTEHRSEVGPPEHGRAHSRPLWPRL